MLLLAATFVILSPARDGWAVARHRISKIVLPLHPVGGCVALGEFGRRRTALAPAVTHYEGSRTVSGSDPPAA